MYYPGLGGANDGAQWRTTTEQGAGCLFALERRFPPAFPAFRNNFSSATAISGHMEG